MQPEALTLSTSSPTNLSLEINQHHQSYDPLNNRPVRTLNGQDLIGPLSQKGIGFQPCVQPGYLIEHLECRKILIWRSTGHGGLSPQLNSARLSRLHHFCFLPFNSLQSKVFPLSSLLIGDLRLKCHVVAYLKRRQGDTPTTMTPQLTEQPPQLAIFVTPFRCFIL